MANARESALLRILEHHEGDLLAQWAALLRRVGGNRSRIGDAEVEVQCQNFISGLRTALRSGHVGDIDGPQFEPVRELLSDISRSRAIQGFSPGETATFVFSLRQPFLDLLREAVPDPQQALDAGIEVSLLIDQLGLFTAEAYQKTREEIILRQQQEIAELSTPVVKLWDGILALPLIGTLDSSRTQVVMENLLQSIVDQSASIAIIDITGVPTVDTLVAQHLLKTVAAARLMGADCIISGIRPQIAQTMVHLGVELNVVSKSSLADAFNLALQRTGKAVLPVRGLSAGA